MLARSREVAVRRAQTLVFQVDAQGRWNLTPAGDTASIATGVVRNEGASLTFRITPLGVCLAEDQAVAASWDAIACANASSSERR